MKKVLFATTALVATAGVAAADVTFGGYGRFGIVYNESAADETQLDSRFRLIVTATTESDNGLSFGAQVRYQSDEFENGYSATNTAAFNTPRFWVSTGGLTVSVGHVQGAIEFMPGMYDGGVGFTGLGFAEAIYSGADFYSSGGQGRFGVDVVYSAGAFGVHLSHSFDDAYLTNINGGVERTALAVSYTTGNYTFAIAAQDSAIVTDTDLAITASGSFGAADVTLKYADNGLLGDAFGIGVNYALSDATTLAGYINNNEAFADETAIGVGVRHSLGGGASIRAGIAEVYGNTVADAGVVFNF